MRQSSLREFDPGALAGEVESRIRRFARGDLLVAWSGGKDSTLVLLAALSAAPGRVVAAYIHVVGQTHADNVRVALSVADRLGLEVVRVRACGRRLDAPRVVRPPALLHILSGGTGCRGFWALVRDKGWPVQAGGERWCCSEFKIKPLESVARRLHLRRHVVGVKASDSWRRARILSRLGPGLPVIRHQAAITLYPIHDLSDGEVWALLRHYDRGIHDAVRFQYERWGFSPNCALCPMSSRGNWARAVENTPTRALRRYLGILREGAERACSRSPTGPGCESLSWRIRVVEGRVYGGGART